MLIYPDRPSFDEAAPAELIQNDFRFTEKEAAEVKGFGPKQLYTLEGTHTPSTIGP